MKVVSFRMKKTRVERETCMFKVDGWMYEVPYTRLYLWHNEVLISSWVVIHFERELIIIKTVYHQVC